MLLSNKIQLTKTMLHSIDPSIHPSIPVNTMIKLRIKVVSHWCIYVLMGRSDNYKTLMDLHTVEEQQSQKDQQSQTLM